MLCRAGMQIGAGRVGIVEDDAGPRQLVQHRRPRDGIARVARRCRRGAGRSSRNRMLGRWLGTWLFPIHVNTVGATYQVARTPQALRETAGDQMPSRTNPQRASCRPYEIHRGERPRFSKASSGRPPYCCAPASMKNSVVLIGAGQGNFQEPVDVAGTLRK